MFDYDEIIANHKRAQEELRAQAFVVGECNCNECIDQRRSAKYIEIMEWYVPKGIYVPLPNKTRMVDNEISRLAYALVDCSTDFSKKQQELLKLCSNCCQPTTTATKKGDYYFCKHCAPRWSQCKGCGEWGDDDYKLKVWDAKAKKYNIMCRRCAPDNLVSCSGCGGYHERGISSPVLYRYEEYKRPNYVYVCPQCDSKKIDCEECGEPFHEILARRDRENRRLCNVCYEQTRLFHDYYYKPVKTIFHSTRFEGPDHPQRLYLGLEIEVCNWEENTSKDYMCKWIQQHMGSSLAYCMHDGTIERSTNRDGIEIVTMPFTWQYFKTVMSDKLIDTLVHLRDNGWRADKPGIGLHVHTSKAAWGRHQLYKLLSLVYGNQKKVQKIAGRGPNDWCTYGTDLSTIVVEAKNKKNRSRDHYNAVNLNYGDGNSSNTVEFRMFQGTLEPFFMFKNIEFVHACWSYTNASSSTSWVDFVNYIHNNAGQYKSLSNFMKGIK